MNARASGQPPLPGMATPLQDGELVAAIDLGSNSFHMVVAQYLLGQLRVVDRLRETVRLGEGLDVRGTLSREARARAFDCLSRFGQRIRDIPPHRVRALATNTVRRLAVPQAFLMPAESALGHAIEVVSGREEARLVYLGVAHAQPPAPGKLRLVIDIGGGSTEFIIGSGLDPLERESLQAGSIATTRRFFADGRLDRGRWEDARTEVLAEFQQFAVHFRARGWDDAIGSSGTAKAIGAICAAMGLTKGAITAAALPRMRDALLAARRIDAIDLPGLNDERRPIIAGGLLVMEAAFQALGLERLMTSKAAMREGVLHDMVGRGGADDPRDAAVDAMVQRYGIDREQALRVEATALRLFDQLAGAWLLDHDDRLLLARAARLHELGLTIAHSQYHVHGAYVVEHSDIAGFSRQQQQYLAALVRTQRRKIPKHAFDVLPDRLLRAARHNAALLRLAVLIHRGHEADPIPVLEARADGEVLELGFQERWLQARPLLRADLEDEPAAMRALGLELRIRTR